MADHTFCFCDIEGSTSLLRRIGEARYSAGLERYRTIVRRELVATDGVEVKAEGDGFLFDFLDPAQAIAFAAGAQAALLAEDWPADAVIRGRMGLHRGPAESRDDGDFVALAVHQAARVEAAGHGGQVLLTGSALAPCPDGVGTRSLGRYLVRDFEGGVELFQLIGPQLADGFPPPRFPRDAHGLPLPSSPLVGRDDLLDRVARLAAVYRLVTLLGPSGVGKTRLALEAAARQAPSFAGGVSVVTLSAVAGPDHVVDAVATALAVRPAPGEPPYRAVVALLSRSPRLVLLDSAERVLDGVAALVDDLLRDCPATHLIVTSTQAAHLRDERVVHVGPLDLDGGGDPVGAAGVTLLRQRLVAEGVDVEAADSSQVVELARAVDGLPLAIELAASRVASIGLEAVVAGLRDRFALLHGGYRGAPERHQRLESAIAWSADLLKPDDRSLMRRLSQLRGQWHVAEALECLAADGLEFQRLVDASLLQVDPARGLWRMLDSIRDFAEREIGEADLATGALAAWLRPTIEGWLHESEDAYLSGVDRLSADALAVSDPVTASDLDAAAGVAAMLAGWFDMRGRHADGLALYDRYLAMPLGPIAKTLVLAASCGLLAVMQRLTEAAARADEAMAVDVPIRAGTHRHRLLYCGDRYEGDTRLGRLAEAVSVDGGDVAGELGALLQYGVALVQHGQVEEGLTRLRNVIDHPASDRYPSHAMVARLNTGTLLAQLGQIDEAEALLAIGRAQAEQAGVRHVSALALSSLALVARRRGDVEAERAYSDERLAIALERGDDGGAATALVNLQDLALRQGDVAEAVRRGEQAAEICARVGNDLLSAVLAMNLGRLAVEADDRAATRRWLDDLIRLARRGTAAAACYAPLLASAASGEPDDRAVVLAGAARALSVATHVDLSDADWLDERLGAAGADESVRARGAALDASSAVDLAAEVLSDLQI